MATNIEQIFRSFVVSKFREIQQQQLGSGKLGQPNGEIDSSEQVKSADDTIASIGVLQNDPLVQKIEQVLSEVLGAEPQYKPDAGQDTVKNKSRSAKRGIPDEVQDEIPRKKSKKDKKHKDKKKKKRKKEKKEKKYKKQSKESKLNYDHKGCEDIQPASCLNSKSLVLSAENMDVGSTSPLKHDSEWFMEKTVYENVNSSLSNSHDASNSDTSKLYASEEDSVLINIQELCEVQVTNEKELETDICQHTNLVVNIPVEDEFLNTAIEGDNTCVKEVEQAETGSALRTAENINVPENSPKFMTVELEDLETRVEFHSVEVKELDSLSESLDPEVLAQPESISLEKTECKLMKTHLETIVEAKDSVTTLGFLAMVVGKDFEATSEFLNKAKVKVSGSSSKDDAKGMRDELEQDSERIAMMKELEKTLRTESRLEKKDLEENSATEKEDSESISESDERKSIDASVEPETIRMGELKETQTPAIVIKLKDPLKYQKSVEPEMRDFRRMSELEVMKRADSRAHILDKKVETKNVDTAAESEEMDVRCLSGTTVCESEKEKWDNIPERMGLKNLRSPEFAGAVRVNYLEASLETAVEKKDDMVVSEDSEMAVEVKVSASTPRSEMTPETLKITKTQYLDFSKQGTVTDIGGETDINLKDLKKVPEQPSVTLKNLETVSEMQYLTGMKHVKNVLQSDVTTQGKDLESNLKPEGQREDKDLDAASESLHMIFTNYSEHSLELYTEPEATMEVKNSEKVPELLPMEDVNNSEALSPMEVKGLKTIESTTVVKLNDLEKKIEYLHRGVKNRGTESKALTDVKYLETYVQSEPGTKERDKKVPSYSVTGVKQKALDTAESLGKGQYDAETADWKIKSGCLSMKDTTEKEPSAEIKRPLFISESFQEVSILNSETAPEVDAIPGMQELKETGRYIPILEVDSPDTSAGLGMSALIDPKDASKLLNTAEDFESISGYQVVENLDSLQFANDQAINFDSQRALQVKYTVSSPKLLFSDELTNLQEKQKLEESTEAASFTTAPESPDTSGTELIVASESGEVHEVIDAEHCSKTIYMEQANSDNFLKSLYTMHLKGSKTISESKIMDAKNLEIEPEYSHREGIETEHFSEYESVASSQVLEISEESPKKNEMQESNTAFGSKTLTVLGLEVNSETLCAINIDNLEVVKKAHVAPTSLGMISTEGTRIPVSAMEDKDIKASETVKTKVEIKHLLASTTPVGIARETFHPIHVTDSKVSEASQMLETNLESVHKKEVNTKLDHEAVLSGSETFKKPKPVVGTSTTEGMLPVINIAEENKSGTDLKPKAALVEKYSESVSESNKVSATKDCDSALSLFMVDVKDSELRSDFLDAGQVKTLNTTVQFETTPEPLCVLELGNSDDVVEPVLTTEMKELGETLNCEVVLEAKHSGPTATNVITSELKPSESLCVLEISNSEGIIELTTPTYLSSAHLKPSDKTTEIETLDSNSEAPLKSGMDVKYFESVSKSDCVLEQFHYKTVPESEYVLEEKVSETSELVSMKHMEAIPELVSMKHMEAIPEPKHAQETKDLEPLAQSVCVAQATCVEKNIVYAEVRDVSETTPKFSGIIEIKDLGATMSSVLAEMEKKSDENLLLYFEEKCSETATECVQMPDLMETSADVESVCRIEGNYAEMACVIDNENSKANSGLTGVTELKDTAFVKSKTGPEPGHLKDLEAVPNSESLGKVKDMQIAQSSIDKKEGMYFEGSSESVLILERQDLERDSTSVLGSEVVSEESLKSVPAVKAKDSEVALKYIDAKGVEISEQNAKYVCMGEMKDLPSVLEHVELAQAKSSETFSEGTLEVKNLEAAMCLAKEKKSEATVLASLEEQILKASLEPICGAEKNNLVVSQQVMREMKDSEAASESVNMLEKEASSCISLKDQHSEAVPESSEITKKNDESISKDRKSEKVSSKSKDKSKSGKKTKKSRSKSPSKSKKRKKKSRSRSTSRQMSSRRARSRSKNDSDSRKKHSTSRRRSRSNSAEKKESKEKSLRTRRRRSRTSDRHKSRSKSVDKRETSLWSRRRHSRSSDRRKSRSRSIDRRESIRTRRRLSRSSDNRKSRSKSYDRREILIRSRRRLSRSSDRHKSRSRSTDKRETSIRTRRRRSRSSEYHKSRSRSVEKRETSVRRRRRRSRSSDNYKSRSKSVDRRESSVRSRRRRSRSSDHHKSRSRSVDDKREISVRTRRKRSRSSENRRSQSKSVEKRESLRPRRRRSRSSDNRKSRSKSGDKETPRTRRRRSRSSDNRKTRSESVDKRESSVRARRRRSRSSDRKSRSKSVDKRESSVRAKRRRSRSSDNKSRSKSVDRRETSTRAKDRRSRSSDNRKSRSKSVDKRETSTRAKRRRSRSCDNRKSRSKSVDKRESSVRARRRRSRSSDNRKSRSKSFDKRETSARSKRKRSRSSENCKSRSKSVDKTDVSGSSKRRRSKSSDHKPVTKASDKRDSSSKSGLRRSKSLDRQKSKSKSRSKSSERKKDKDSSDVTKGKGSKSRSKSKSPEKTEGTEVSEATVHSHAKSPEHPKSKSRSRSKSLDKTRDRPRRSRSKCSEPKSHSHRTVSRSRRNRSRSLTRKRTSRSKSDNRSHSRSRSRSCSRRWRRSRSRSVSRHRSLSRERRRRSRRNRSRSVDRRRRRSDSRDSYRIPLRLRSRSRTPVQLRTTRSAGRRRSTSVSPDHRRSRSASRSPKRLTDLDKAQLLEIAKANAAAMCAKAGVPLPPSLMPVATPEKKEEKVTQKSAKETIMELTEKCKKIAQSQEDDVILNKPHVSDEEEEEHPFINHPFKLSEPKPIFFNLTTPTIKPAPPKNQVTLTKEFPVSSGSQHRKKEADSAYGEWVPVEKNKEENKDDVFPNPATLEPVDISSALSERTIAQKRLTENTFDLEAMCLLNRAQERIDAWAQLNSLPGQFTGSTGAQVLSSEQLSNSGPQAWIKKDQFLRAAPVTGGMGAQLMRKMGWREGEGLGKNKEGSREPILVDFKTDRKGLVAVGEKTQKRHGAFSGVKDLAGKHPISVLVEACNKRRWPPPTFVLVTDNGPDHRKCFLFKVMVNGVEHKPTFASPNKKLAKTTAATVALQALGIVPKELLVNATSFRSASHN